MFDSFKQGLASSRISHLVGEDDASLLKEIKDRLQLVEDWESEQRQREIENMEFIRPGGHWDPIVRASRASAGKATLELDRLLPFLDRIINEFRMQNASIQVNPTDEGASQETAKMLQGHIRHICYSSNADVAFVTAFESMLRCSRGWNRISTRYVDDVSNDQEIFIERVPNHLMVYKDPSSVEPDGSDMEWLIIMTDHTREEYARLYPDSKMTESSANQLATIGNAYPGWMLKDKKGCRVAEYFKKVYDKHTLCILDDHSTILDDDLPDGVKPKTGQVLPNGLGIMMTREVRTSRVKWYKVNAVETLAEGDWAGKYIPLVPWYGQEINIDNKIGYYGFTDRGKDAQRAIDYWQSAIANAITLAPSAPYFAPVGSLSKETRQVLAEAHLHNSVVIEYNQYDSQGQGLNQPQRTFGEPAIQAMSQALSMAIDALKGSLGMWDASLGRSEGDQSGIALRQLRSQGDLGNFHFRDNAARAIRMNGRIIVDLIQKTYDTPKTVRVINEDETHSLAKVNQETGKTDKQGNPVTHDVQSGSYDVTISTGPSYQSRRQEDQAAMSELLNSPLGQFIGQTCPDLIIASQDFAGAKQMVERIKRALPPELVADENEEQGQPKIPPQAQQAMQQMQQQMQQAMQAVEQLTEQLHAAQDELDDKNNANELKRYIADLNAQTKLLTEELKTNQAKAGLALKFELDRLKAELTQPREPVVEQTPPEEPMPEEVAYE